MSSPQAACAWAAPPAPAIAAEGAATARGEPPFVSVIVPCRDEAAQLRACLESIAANDYPRHRLEVLVIDGRSEDGTLEIAEEFSRRLPFVHLLDNPRQITPAALNIGVVAARGDVILRMDAHCDYPPDYISSLLRGLEESGADNVGGVCLTQPARDTAVARAIAVGLSHPLGVGNSHFRIGTAARRWVDTVPFGCYRREVFDRIGLFDEELARNQDDEFNLRLRKSGGRILLVPEVASRYYPRSSLRKLWQMYSQYGFFKPLVIRKVGAVMTIRQVVPSLFVAALAVLGVSSLWSRWGAALLGALLFAYAAAMFAAAIPAARRHGLGTAGWLFLVFPCLHLSYGIGFLRGLVRFLLLPASRRPAPCAVPLSR